MHVPAALHWRNHIAVTKWPCALPSLCLLFSVLMQCKDPDAKARALEVVTLEVLLNKCGEVLMRYPSWPTILPNDITIGFQVQCCVYDVCMLETLAREL